MVYCNHNHSHLIFVHKLNGSFYVRLCNGVSDKKIRQVVRQFQPQSFQQLRKFVPVGNQCGKCVRAAREVMEDELTTMPEFKEIA